MFERLLGQFFAVLVSVFGVKRTIAAFGAERTALVMALALAFGIVLYTFVDLISANLALAFVLYTAFCTTRGLRTAHPRPAMRTAHRPLPGPVAPQTPPHCAC